MSSTAFPPLSPSEPPRVFGAPTLHTESDLLAVGIAADGTLWSVEEPGLLRQWSLGTRRQLREGDWSEFQGRFYAPSSWPRYIDTGDAYRIREGKIERVRDWLAGQGRRLADFPDSSFYSDSLNDLPLLELVARPVAVDPDPTLAAEAARRGWPVISLR